ncbi:MAG: hypothetical protein CM15mP74_16990 [Halieaceae bacterium]|nr:MAG: hypothetical protein CM15mP74_16990 [Halieaceae bacterium]
MTRYLVYFLASCVLTLLAADAMSKDGPLAPARAPTDKIPLAVTERIDDVVMRE